MPVRPEKVTGCAAEGDAQAGQLGQAPGDDRAPGVVAEAHAVGDAGGDGDDVLEGAAQLAADDVGVGVDPEASRW